jgi:hypothetical protein
MNENRSVFALDGVTGYFIAVALLLSILAYLTIIGIGAQKNNATTFYKLDEKQLKANSVDNAKLYHVVKQ